MTYYLFITTCGYIRIHAILTASEITILVVFFISELPGGQIKVAEKNKIKSKKLVVRKKRETVRERADKSTKNASKTPRTRKLKSAAMRPVGSVRSVLSKEYAPIKTSSSKVGKFLGKRSRITPMYFIEAFAELRQVTWPTKRTAAKLTLAVFLFSVGLASLVKALDYGFDWLFKDVILK